MTLTFDLRGHRDCRSYASWYFVRVQSANFVVCPHGSDVPRDILTLTYNVGSHGACRWLGSTSSIHTPTLKFLGLTVRKIWHVLWVCVSRPVTLTFEPFDLETGAKCSTCHGVPSGQFWWYYDYSCSIYGPLGQHGSDWLHDLVTFDLEGHGACSWCRLSSSIRVPSLKFVDLKLYSTVFPCGCSGPFKVIKTGRKPACDFLCDFLPVFQL